MPHDKLRATHNSPGAPVLATKKKSIRCVKLDIHFLHLSSILQLIPEVLPPTNF